MEENFYTINELCEELDEPRHKIRRRLIKLNIKAINEDTRNYKNEPLEYDHQTFLKLVEEFDIKFINRESTALYNRKYNRKYNEWTAFYSRKR